MKKNINFKEISVHDTPAQSPGFLLWHISTAWRRSIELSLKSIGLTHPQFVILATLGWLTRDGNRVTQAKISEMSGVDPNTVSQIIKGLKKKELIKFEKSQDTRAKNPILTSKGDDILRKALPVVEKKDEEIFRNLIAADIENMLSIFQKLMPTRI